MCDFRRENHRGTLGRQHQVRLLRAEVICWDQRMKRLRPGSADGRKRDDDDGLGIAKRWRSVEAEIERIFRRQGERGNVLEMRGVERGKNSGSVNDSADVGAVGACTAKARVADLVHQVLGAAAGDLGDERLGIGVVEHETGGVLGEAGDLLVDGAFKAVLVDFDAEAAGGHLRMFLQGFGIGLRSDLDLGEVGFNAHPVPTGSLQILGGTDKSAWPIMHGLAQRIEVASGFRGEENEGLLRFSGNGDEDAFIAHIAVPGFDAGKPIRRGRIGCASQKGNHEDKVSRLTFRQVGMNPEPVTRHQVGGLRDGQSDVAALYMDVDFRSGEVESRAIGVQSGWKKTVEQQEQQTTTHDSYCTKLQRLSERGDDARIALSNVGLTHNLNICSAQEQNLGYTVACITLN